MCQKKIHEKNLTAKNFFLQKNYVLKKILKKVQYKKFPREKN